jgi:beta-galactosidase
MVYLPIKAAIGILPFREFPGGFIKWLNHDTSMTCMPDFDALLEIAGRKTWKLSQLTGFNKLPPRSTTHPFSSSEEALTLDRGSSPWFLSLNGVWDFKILSRPEEATDDIISGQDWNSIHVPGNWTMQGFGHPHYTNVVMTFPNIPPDVPEINPTDYWAAFEKYPGLQGGFLWEWIDHGILQTSPEGKEFWAYGGDFGDEPNDANFCIDGIVWPNRKPHPALHEFKYLAQPLKVELDNIARGRIRIINKQDFIPLSWLYGLWELTCNGTVVSKGKLPDLDILPGKSKPYELPISAINRGEGEYFLNFHFFQRESNAWTPAGHEVAWEQLLLTKPRGSKILNHRNHEVTRLPEMIENGNLITLSSDGVSVVFNQELGELVEFSDGINLLQRGPLLNVWRAAVDNDGIKLLSNRSDESWKVLSFWKSLGLPALQHRLKPFRVLTKPDQPPSVIITHSASGRENWIDFTHIHCYTLLSSGKLLVTNQVMVANGIIDLPRVGIDLCLNSTLEQLEWYGRGLWENYPDRKSSAMIGHYTSTVNEEYVPYIMPQEHGHKTDVRWLSLCNHNGRGIKVVGSPTFEFSASHFIANDLYSARHTYELSPRSDTWLNLDHCMRGLDTASCGPDTLDQYRLLKSKYEFTYSLELINKSTTND